MTTRFPRALLAAAGLAGAVSACGTEPPSGGAVLAASAPCSDASRTVRDATGLRAALAAAQPGDAIRLDDGVYAGAFVITAKGRKEAPIRLCGSRAAILDGKGDAKYVLHLNGASWWELEGFAVRDGRKGVIADRATNNVLSGLHVSGTGDEAVHLRTHSTDNLVTGLTVRDTGHRREKFGEGIYVGSAHSNWCEYTACQPDRSDRNRIVGNHIEETTSEAIDIKEGTVDGLVERNRISGAGMTKADSWIDVKGNDWIVENNTGTDSPEDGIQVHVVVKSWGARNIIRNNELDVNGPGYGIYIHEKDKGNVVACDNKVSDAKRGFANVPCR